MTDGANGAPGFSMDIAKGKEIDGYKILDVVGRGGMGVVYLAEDVALSRRVALKVIDPALARDESFLRRFRAEARALARIDNPHIVRVHALRQTDIGVFIVMEYVEGGTLADAINRGPMPWPDAVPLIKQMLHAFAHAHGVGVIHRDIKPSNIMLTAEHVVKVTDFGLAKLHQKNVDATVTQGISGTLFYMSPEQVKGLRDLDHRTDIYSLGMTVYEMLAGRVPLERGEGEFAVLKKIVEVDPPPPSRYARDLPDGLVRIVMKALEKDPARRYQSADDMLSALASFEEDVADHKPAQRARASSGSGLLASTGRRSLLVAGVALLVVLVTAAGVLAYQNWFSAGSSSLLDVTTMPDGVMVYVGDRLLGETPLRDEVVDYGPVDMRLVKAGFLTVDTTLAPQEDRRLALDVRMTAATDRPTATASIRSTPDDAEVWIDGRVVGRTPFTLTDAEPGSLMVVLRKDGFDDLELVERLEADVESVIAAALQPTVSDTRERDASSTSSTRPATGTLSIDTDTDGSVEVDGRAVGAGSMTLESGVHTVACGEAPHRFETSVTVRPRETLELTCYFTTTVNVVTTMADGTSTWASIWIDGANAGLAPAELKLQPGNYRVSVRREGFQTLDEEKSLALKPGLEPRTVQLAFRIARE